MEQERHDHFRNIQLSVARNSQELAQLSQVDTPHSAITVASALPSHICMFLQHLLARACACMRAAHCVCTRQRSEALRSITLAIHAQTATTTALPDITDHESAPDLAPRIKVC